MIPRKLAKRLLTEYVDLMTGDDGLWRDDLGADDGCTKIIAESDLVLRGAENVEQKARRYLAEGRIRITRVLPAGLVVAEARGSAGEAYVLGYDPAKKEWRCTCPVIGRRNRCSHIAALQLVVAARP